MSVCVCVYIYISYTSKSFPSLSKMDHKQFDNWVGHEEHLDFSGFPLWRNWQLDFPLLEEEIIEAIPLMQRYPSEPLFPPQDLFGEFNVMFDEENDGLWDGICGESTKERNLMLCDGEENMRKEKKLCREEKKITFEDVSKYFYMPITQAAKELNVGLTLLKKKCRELGIPRWPHRKMKSLQTLIKNVKELEREDGDAGEAQLRSTIERLEQERKLMEKKPAMKMEEKTKMLRQACFKNNYKKRRLMAPPPTEGDDHYYSPPTNITSVMEFVNVFIDKINYT